MPEIRSAWFPAPPGREGLRLAGGSPAVVLLAAGPASAQKYQVKFDGGTRVGLPPGPVRGEQDDSGRASPVVKRNTWAPIYLKLQMGEKAFSDASQADAYLHVDGQDGDGLGIGYRLSLGNLFDRQPGTTVEPGEFPHMPYARPTGRGELTLTVRSADGTRLSEPFRVNILDADPAAFVVLTLGTKLTTFSLKSTVTNQETGNFLKKGLRGGRVVPAACVDPMELPDQWFGYSAADVVILPTGETKPVLLDALFGDQSADPKFKVRRETLFEWVRRGGKLIISTGTNADKLAQYPLLQKFLVASISETEPKFSVAKLKLPPMPEPLKRRTVTLEPKKATDRFPVANLTADPGRGVRVMMDAADPDNPARLKIPVVLQWPYGLGKVTDGGVRPRPLPFCRQYIQGRDVGLASPPIRQPADVPRRERKKKRQFVRLRLAGGQVRRSSAK